MWVTVAEAAFNLGAQHRSGSLLQKRFLRCARFVDVRIHHRLVRAVAVGRARGEDDRLAIRQNRSYSHLVRVLPLLAFLFMGRYFAWLDFRSSMLRFFTDIADCRPCRRVWTLEIRTEPAGT